VKLFPFLLPVCLFAQAGSLDLVSGTWVNQQETRGVTRVSVRQDGGRTIVHAWGACHPTDCDWGEADADLWNGVPMVIWKQGFATRRMQLVPVPDGRMIVGVESEYQDGSGRKDPGHAEFFARRDVAPDSPETAAARALLHQTAETYRNLPASYFEAVSTETRATSGSEVRLVVQSKILSAPPDKVRVESEGAGEPVISIADGTSEWRVYPKTNEYGANPQAKGPLPIGPLSGFTRIDNARDEPRITGREQAEGVDCTVVRIAMERGVSRLLWIDDATHLVRKSVFNEATRKSELRFPVARLGQAAPPGMFAYDPAAVHAGNRRELARRAPETLVGKPAPDFTLRDLNGAEIQLSALRGKPVLLDFWATWCGYCREALPAIELLHRGLKDKLAVFGIDNEEPELAREYLRKNGYTLPTLADPKDEAVNLYRLNGWPTTILIDREGKVAYYELGFESQKLRDALRAAGVW
jgi:cytochrome c biogenesis protein CcmG/thiol:disulfide interchange protein DsbE